MSWLDWLDEREAELEAMADPWDRYRFASTVWSDLCRGVAAQVGASAPPMPNWEPIDDAHADARWARVVRRWEAKHRS